MGCLLTKPTYKPNASHRARLATEDSEPEGTPNVSRFHAWIVRPKPGTSAAATWLLRNGRVVWARLIVTRKQKGRLGRPFCCGLRRGGPCGKPGFPHAPYI